MTGLCGYIGTRPRGPAGAVLQSMTDRLIRVPDETRDGRATETAGLAGRGWTGEADFYEDADCLAFMLGRPRWRDDDGRRVAGAQGNAAALVSVQKAHPDDVLNRIGGAFSFALLWPEHRRALVAADRMGEFGICYSRLPDGGVVFASSADAVCAWPGMDNTLDPQGIYDFLHFYVSPAPGSVFRAQEKLRAAHLLEFDDGAIRTRPYWTPDWRGGGEAASPADEKALAETMRDRISAAAARATKHAGAGGPGAFLSGGLDSTSVCGMLAQQSDAPVKCFTVGFHETAYDETPWAEIAARAFGLDHHVHRLTPEEAFAVFPEIVASYDEPFANSSAIPALICARDAAAAGVSAMIAGDGGDEIFAGNERYLEQGVFDPYRRLPRGLRSAILTPLLAATGRLLPVSIFRRAGNYARLADTPLPDRLYDGHPLTVQAPLLFADGALPAGAEENALRPLREIYDQVENGHRIQKMMRLDWQLALADNDLRKVGRMCALAGVRVRYPFLDDDLVGFATSIDPVLLMKDRKLRGFYKTAMSGFLPDPIINKPKHGFGMPFEQWLTDHEPFRDLACESLLGLASRPLFKSGALTELADSLAKGESHPLSVIAWDLVTLELWWNSRDFT